MGRHTQAAQEAQIMINVNGQIYKIIFEFESFKGVLARKMHGKNRGNMKVFTSWLCFTVD